MRGRWEANSPESLHELAYPATRVTEYGHWWDKLLASHGGKHIIASMVTTTGYSINDSMRSFDLQQLDFLEQCMIGDEYKIRHLLQSGMVDSGYRHKINGWSGLHWAARRGHEAICLLLLEHGFDRCMIDHQGQTPFDVCAESNSVLREILRPESSDEEMRPETSGSRKSSRDSGNASGDSPGFVPSYIRHPPFPYVSKQSSLDLNLPVSPSPTTQKSYSYGRRDSINRTRFLLVRTSYGDGKEAYKRVTLPGGSTVDHLKKTIETAMRNGPVDSVLTLPDRVLVDDNKQIQQFGDCQKVEVVFGDHGRVPSQSSSCEPIAEKLPESTHSVKETIMEPSVEKETSPPSEMEPQVEVSTELPDVTPTDVTKPDHADGDNENSGEDVNERDVSPVSYTVPSDRAPSPPVEPESDKDVEARPAVRQSVDSDPGHDYVKVEDENRSLITEDPSIPPDMTMVFPPEDVKPLIVAEADKDAVESKDKNVEKGGLGEWMRNNPDAVRHGTAAAALLGVAGLGCYIYARKLK